MREAKKITRNLETIAENIRVDFSARDVAREKALRLCREIIRHSANTIRAVHRREYIEAEQLLKSVSVLVQSLNQEIANNHTEMLHLGFVHDAEKEFAEASITFAIINLEPLPAPEKLNVSYHAYLNGIGEATGELRRYILDSLRRKETVKFTQHGQGAASYFQRYYPYISCLISVAVTASIWYL